ncbi:hypothetical protein [Rhodopirellula halodulae]|uniref:hypothetical protein n=1 Tax=Rhodopirellula halodulae TaxID=2894198 RepID=UPI001E35001F|nr:hypothetical protein [Rhodopirellula sp. JC740]
MLVRSGGWKLLRNSSQESVLIPQIPAGSPRSDLSLPELPCGQDQIVSPNMTAIE